MTMLRNGKGDLPALREAFNGRKDASIRSKVRKFRVKHDLFGDAYREGKIKFSEKIVRATNPKTVFEAYAGAGHQTLIWAKKAEAKAICAALGEHAKRPAVSATKSMTGHLLGAAGGGVEAVFTVLAIAESAVPPTINLDDPDPECPLNHVAKQAREMEVNVAISNSFGFGGANASILFRKI